MKRLILPILFLYLGCVPKELINQEKVQKEIFFTVPINLNFPDNTSDELITKDFEKIYHDQAVLKLPISYSETGTPTRLVYCAHGAGGGVKNGEWYLNRLAMIDTLLNNGYACFDVNGGSNLENMGGSWVVQSAYKAYEYIKTNYNIYDEIFVWGGSMGGLSSTNFIYRHKNIVLAHGMFSPVLSLKDQAWDNPWYHSTRKSITETYNFEDQSGNNWEPEKITGWEPILTNTIISGEDTFKIYPTPVKIWHGSKDATVSVITSRKFQKYIKNANGFCELRELDSNNHGLSGGAPYMNKELILFFKRFDN